MCHLKQEKLSKDRCRTTTLYLPIQNKRTLDFLPDEKFLSKAHTIQCRRRRRHEKKSVKPTSKSTASQGFTYAQGKASVVTKDAKVAR